MAVAWLLLVMAFSFTVATASPGVPHQFLQRAQGGLGLKPAPLLRACAPLCWEEYDRAVDLHEYYRLDGCYQFNVSSHSKNNPMFNGWTLQPVEFKGGYLYRNSWTDFSLGDDTFAFQSFRNRWTWTPDASEIVHTSVYESVAQPEAKMEVFDTVAFTSTVYRLYNATFVVKETMQTTQEISCAGPAKLETTHETSFLPRLLDCNNSA